jgi:hypothetical protein
VAEPIKYESHYNNILDRLPMQFRDKTNISAILKAFGDTAQDVENDLWDIKVKTKWFNAEGVNLDRYGHWAGLIRRTGEGDLKYRDRIAKVIISRASHGSPDSIRTVIQAVLGIVDTDCIEYMHPALWESTGEPLMTGGVFLYGYDTPSRRRSLRGGEAKLLRSACPATTGSVVFGLHQILEEGINSLFIPCELIEDPDIMGVNIDVPPITGFELVDEINDNIGLSSGQFDRFGINWEQGLLAEDGYTEDSFGLALEEGEETLDVDTVQGVEALNVYSLGIEKTKGILLEIDIHFNGETY